MRCLLKTGASIPVFAVDLTFAFVWAPCLGMEMELVAEAVPDLIFLIINDMSYKKNDILLFMTNEPQAHLCEMFSHETVIKEEIEKEPYYGFVKSVISAKDGIYLMQTLKPRKGCICVTETANIIRLVDKNELPEEEREREPREYMEAPNVYIPAHNADYSALTEQEHCIALVKEAMEHLFPGITIEEFNFKSDWFSHSQFVSTLDYFDAFRERIKDAAIKAKLLRMKDEILKHVPTARFKEYFTVKVGISTAVDTYYIIVAVSKEFDEVCVLRDINDRSNFFRSLGPEFVDLSHAVDHYRDKVLEVAFPKSTTTTNK